MLIIVGLGNFGIAYRNTYHNMGFLTVDKLADRLGVAFTKRVAFAKVAVAKIDGEQIIIAKPQTYMNNSGDSVSALISYYKARPEDVIVIYDDVDIPKGRIRIRGDGSGGTHNGMKSVVASVGNKVVRIRVGTKKDDDRIPMIDYVLSKPDKQSIAMIEPSLERAADALEFYIKDRNVERLMSKYNINE